MGENEFSEISKVSVSDTRNIVLSSRRSGGYAIAQQLKVAEGSSDKVTMVFLKGAMILRDLDTLVAFRDMLDEVIEIES